uniref:Uncharacterized protein n=1 Tax=Pyxicephalus adspersus TaxID=30357 RepID=A0AAV2ZTI8_PYXAD|nr:TPA: hypothetical protein GDO54_018323 [Pyxicephalus adspersus]
MTTMSHEADIRRLLHKYVAGLGDSIQRSVNKDLVKILQNDEFWTENQLKGKIHREHAGRLRTGTLARLVIINSCIKDVIRYHEQSLEMYKTNLDHLLDPEYMVIWNMAMPVGFKASEVLEYQIPNVPWDIIEGNFYSTTLEDLHQFNVIDMHFHFRFELHSRVKDATHSNQLAHRKYTCILRRSVDSIGNWHLELGTGQVAAVPA